MYLNIYISQQCVNTRNTYEIALFLNAIFSNSVINLSVFYIIWIFLRLSLLHQNKYATRKHNKYNKIDLINVILYGGTLSRYFSKQYLLDQFQD